MQELLGHEDVSTTMIYTHVMNKGGKGVLSPLDKLRSPAMKTDVAKRKPEDETDPQE